MSRLVITIAAVTLSLAGCIGNIRETTSPRSATEMLLISTAAQRAVLQYEAETLAGRKVFIDMTNFDSIDKGYVVSALRDHLATHGAIIVAAQADSDVVLEVRNGGLGIYDGAFTLGVPPMPIGAPGIPAAMVSPPLYVFSRKTSQGWAKFDFWTYDPKTMLYLNHTPSRWGSAFYNQWFVFGLGPFDGSNDIYPDWDMDRFSDGSDEDAPQPDPMPPEQQEDTQQDGD
jgi:hypothetical protein